MRGSNLDMTLTVVIVTAAGARRRHIGRGVVGATDEQAQPKRQACEPTESPGAVIPLCIHR